MLFVNLGADDHNSVVGEPDSFVYQQVYAVFLNSFAEIVVLVSVFVSVYIKTHLMVSVFVINRIF